MYKHLKSPGGYTENHIKSVEVFSSDDGGTGPSPLGVTITADKDGTVYVTPQKERALCLGRLRGEPSVKITLTEECGDEPEWYIYIYHHKGTISIEKFQKGEVRQSSFGYEPNDYI